MMSIFKVHIALAILLIVNSSAAQNIAVIFAHGLGGNHRQGNHYVYSKRNKHGFLKHDPITFNFQDAQNSWLSMSRSCLGQDADIALLQKICLQNNNKPCVLMGVSRGAATIINFMGTQPPANVKALILESPFDELKTVVHNTLGKIYLQWVPGLTKACHGLCSTLLFRNYSIYGIQPKDVIGRIPKEIPVLLICSKQDGLIPYTSTLQLHRKLIESGHHKVQLLITDTGKHARILWGSEGAAYRASVLQFCKDADIEQCVI